MLFRKLKNLFSSPPPANPAPKQNVLRHGSAWLSQCSVFGMHRYRTATEDSTVYFHDDSRGIHRLLVDSRGNIQNFPGIRKEDFWLRQVSPKALLPQIRFRTDFILREGRFAMLWQIQPDGCYWEDSDGYGGTSDEEIRLFACLDEDGCWDGPFRIYDIGDTRYDA